MSVPIKLFSLRKVGKEKRRRGKSKMHRNRNKTYSKDALLKQDLFTSIYITS